MVSLVRYYPPPTKPQDEAILVKSDPGQRGNTPSKFRFVEAVKDSIVTGEDKDPSILCVCKDDSISRHWFVQMLLVPKQLGNVSPWAFQSLGGL